VAREECVIRACEKLFRKKGRKLALTDTGRLVFRHADETLSLVRKLTNTLKGRTPAGRMRGLGLWRARPGRRLSARFSPFAQQRAV
jgi:DNA-binding transcriptional LysR family regulator